MNGDVLQMNFQDFHWADSDIENIHIEYDHATFVIWNDTLQKRLSVNSNYLLKTDKESVLFFEDSYSAIKTAVEYGIECIGVNNKFNKNHKKDLNKLCTFTIKDFRDKKLDYLIK